MNTATPRRIARLLIVALGLSIFTVHLSAKPNEHSTKPQQTSQEKREPTIIVNNENPSPEKQSAQSQSPRWYASPEWILAIVGIVTFVSILYQSIQTKNAAVATKESADALWAGQRAQVVIGPHGNPANDLMSRDARVQLEMVNKGQTPAYDLIYESWFELLPFPFESFSSRATYFRATEKIALYPNSVPILLTIPLLRQLTPVERSSLVDTALYACVRIRVEYRDARAPGRYTEFGYYVKKTSFGYLPKYNDAN